ncbi:superoxide dismutase [Sabulicella rubraurantiaca]|uniref:superoxide dismutase n=1 Tax=Sabulicella rubraurantiaca TaxID=2811429 RepID=UPI001F26B4F6|nr:superoxide dismutase [Sabulicella rubraurantiaca]
MMILSRRLALLGASAALFSARAGFAQQPQQRPTPPQIAPGPHSLPDLPYGLDANEAAIDARTMELHHRFHHAAYVNNLNNALREHEAFGRMPLDELLMNLSRVPENVRTAIRNNGGGHANHTMFWEIMGGRGGEPTGRLLEAINRDLGGMGEFRNRFNQACMSVFGSGWGFVTVAQSGQLAIATKPNQDTPIMDGQRALMGNDVWEHAYYLRYQNRRQEYVNNWWNVLNWEKIGERFTAATEGRLRV